MAVYSRHIRSEIKRVLLILLSVMLLASTINILLLYLLQKRMTDIALDQQAHIMDTSAYAVDRHLDDLYSQTISLEGCQSLTTLYKKASLPLVEEDLMVRDIIRQMVLMRNQYPFISGYFVYLYNKPYLITGDGYTLPSVHYKNRFALSPDEWLSWLHEKRGFNFSRSPFEVSDKNSQHTDASSLQLSKTLWHRGTAIGLFLLYIDADKFLSNLGSNLMQKKSVIILLQDGQPLSGVEVFDEAEQRGIDLNQAKGHIKGFGLITHRPSNTIKNLSYCIFTPELAVLHDIDDLFLITHILLFLATALVGVAASIAILRAWRPISRLSKLARSVVDSPDGRLSESVLIQDAFETIWRNNAALQHSLKGSAQVSRETALYRLLLGDKGEGNALQNAFIEGLAAGDTTRSFGVYVVQMSLSPQDSELYFAQYEPEIIRSLRLVAGERLVGLVKSGLNELSLICKADKSEQEGLHQAMREQALKLRLAYPDSFFVISVSFTAMQLSDIDQCYKSALRQISDRCLSDNEGLLLTSSPDSPPSLHPSLPTDIQERILNLRTKEEAEQFITGLLAQLSASKVTVGAFIHICNRLNGMMSLRLRDHAPLTAPALLEIDVFNTLYRENELKDILLSNAALMLAYRTPHAETQPSLDNPQEEPASDKPALIDNILTYVDEHCADNINLQTMASVFGYNASYLSRYFKQCKGINFTDYLNSRKIEYACRLLTKRETTVKDAAEMAGFNSVSRFIATFEQYMGITPGLYKKQHKLLAEKTSSLHTS